MAAQPVNRPLAKFGQTVLRFTGALVLAGGATLFDHPDRPDHPRSRNGEAIPPAHQAPVVPAPIMVAPQPPRPRGPVQRLPLHPRDGGTPYLRETARRSLGSPR